MPLTDFQESLILLLLQNRSEDSYLPGGSAINFDPQSSIAGSKIK
jgi:hypothetical protein